MISFQVWQGYVCVGGWGVGKENVKAHIAPHKKLFSIQKY